MAPVYLIPALLLAAGSLLLASRERVVKTAGVLIITAAPLLIRWMAEVMHVTEGEKGLILGLFHALAWVYVMLTWSGFLIWFIVSLRRQQKKEYDLLSSRGRQGGPANEPRELDWRQQPPPGAV